MNRTNHPKISIIVPVYNVSAYIERCVSSLLCQTFTSIEIIFIDDGSTDDSVLKIRSLIKNKPKNKPLVRIIRQQNQGLSSARNAGIKIAQGDYLSFVDSDDAISPNFCEVTYQKAQASKADLVIANRIDCNQNGAYLISKILPVVTSNVTDKKNRLKLCLFGKLSWTAWGKLYKKKLFASKLFAEGRYYEDTILIPEIITDSATMSFVYDASYFYHQRTGAITNSYFSEKHFSDQLFSLECNLALAKKYNIPNFEQQLFLLREFKYSKYIKNFGYLTTYQAAKKFGYNFLLYSILYGCYIRLRRLKRKLFKKDRALNNIKKTHQ